MRRKYFVAFSLAVVFLFLIAASGCSTMRSLVSPVIPKGPELKKKVMVFPLVNQAAIEGERARKLDGDFRKSLESSPHLLVYSPPEGVFSTMSMTSPLFGVVTSSRLVEVAEGMGMNALVIGVMNPIEVTTRKSGIWPFRRNKKFYNVSMGVNVVDIITKTFSMTQIESEEFSIPVEDAEGKDEKGIINKGLEEVLPEILKRVTSVAEKGLGNEPWMGKILAVEDKTVMIDAGKLVGVKPGQTFEVLSVGEAIPSASGRPIQVLGERIGEIRVDSVMEKHSLAVSVKGGKFSAGQVVRFRR
ncbi:MAG: FlgT C-terminal domain-containing protein [Pseudomonadota bacterium]